MNRRHFEFAPLAFVAAFIAVPLVAQVNDGTTESDLVSRALRSNRELWAARMEIDRARARLRQAQLFANPVLEIEQTGGPPLGSENEDQKYRSELSLPIPYGGKRARRIDVARAQIRAAEAEIADRERRLTADVRTAYAESLAAIRELQFTTQLTDIDGQLSRVLQARVREGDAPPLELNLLRVEIDRLRSRRAIVEGRLNAAVIRLKNIAGISVSEPLALQGNLTDVARGGIQPENDAAALALRHRPDLQLAEINVAVAEAGSQLALAEALPDVAIFGSYENTTNEVHPQGIITDEDKLFGLGVGISLPIFNRNQGARAEASAAVEQARRLREAAELRVRADVRAGYARWAAAQAAVEVFEQGVIDQSARNVQTVRAVYEAGGLTISDVLAERRRYVDAQRELTEALTERAIALAELEAAIGIPINRGKENKDAQRTSAE